MPVRFNLNSLVTTIVALRLARRAQALLEQGTASDAIEWAAAHKVRLRSSTVHVGHAVRRIENRINGAECLARSLAGWMILSGSGISAGIVIGAKSVGGDIELHAWLESDDELVGERAAKLDGFERLGVIVPGEDDSPLVTALNSGARLTG
jgi:hypothetical protein